MANDIVTNLNDVVSAPLDPVTKYNTTIRCIRQRGCLKAKNHARYIGACGTAVSRIASAAPDGRKDRVF
jgi:hypothetical protein